MCYIDDVILNKSVFEEMWTIRKHNGIIQDAVHL